MRAAELLRNNFGVSQLYKHVVESDGEAFWRCTGTRLTIAERESIQKKAGSDDAGDFALSLMIEKALDENGKRLFQDGEKAVLKERRRSSRFAGHSNGHADLWHRKQGGGSEGKPEKLIPTGFLCMPSQRARDDSQATLREPDDRRACRLGRLLRNKRRRGGKGDGSCAKQAKGPERCQRDRLY